MKKFILLFCFLSTLVNAQNQLQFNTTNIESVDKWVVFQKHQDSTDYNFGFIYLDASAGLTLDYAGTFKISENGKFIKDNSNNLGKTSAMKIRMEPNNVLIAEIPEIKFAELNIEKTPDWLKYYKIGEEDATYKYKIGFLYNGYNQPEKALKYLLEAEKLDPKYNKLQTELAFSYNAMGNYQKAEQALKKAILQNPKDCYTYKELAYTYTKKKDLQNGIATYNKMAKICEQKNFIEETAHNIAYEYYLIKDKANFKKWKLEAEKWTGENKFYLQNLNQMELELN